MSSITGTPSDKLIDAFEKFGFCAHAALVDDLDNKKAGKIVYPVDMNKLEAASKTLAVSAQNFKENVPTDCRLDLMHYVNATIIYIESLSFLDSSSAIKNQLYKVLHLISDSLVIHAENGKVYPTEKYAEAIAKIEIIRENLPKSESTSKKEIGAAGASLLLACLNIKSK